MHIKGYHGCKKKKDLAQWVTTCGIDLFEQHITLRFPLVRLMNRLLIWCLLIKNWDLCQALAMIWSLKVFLNSPWHPHLQCCPLVVHWLQASGAVNLVPQWGHGCCLPLGGNVELLIRACVCDKDGFLPGRWERCQWYGTTQSLCRGFMVNHNAASQCR